MRSNVKLSYDEAEKPAVIIHARCVPMSCRRSANFDAAGIPAAEGEGAVVGAADAEVLRLGAMVFHHCGELPSGFGDPGWCAGAGGPDVVGGLARLVRPACSARPARPVRRRHFWRNAGPQKGRATAESPKRL